MTDENQRTSPDQTGNNQDSLKPHETNKREIRKVSQGRRKKIEDKFKMGDSKRDKEGNFI